MFWGLVASSATICTNWVRAFWYCSNTEGERVVHLPRPYLAEPASDSWLPRRLRRGDDRDDHSASDGSRSSVYPRLPGNRPEPERGRLAATASPGRDVTVVVRREDSRAWGLGGQGVLVCQARRAAGTSRAVECTCTAGSGVLTAALVGTERRGGSTRQGSVVQERPDE
ncbi:hypothetical protein P7K49_014760 [Saguinus oedipus]|uniref:Secreted protein n=1 Tax=Saguinus oedipus TaxID=9490 RepID=A0ABQ9V7X6_SAGOE|nr:hypothetical protein P7K49_014760 [Saguinus oedipus]